ncbi:hypothetical protein [Aquibium sp. ELW1220]|uniref:hypothetical protein n=1 Tax=Aquibium sp. ELW1220 TaxID=2976766 RepID=UPI0025AFC214|nr:hypothetical protein [Aquibium sp. ELW1220]MDN2583680.1 hypothetical protein [Aquibium sp. ELW1220]
MKLPRAALVTAGLLLAQQAQAASFVVLGGEPVANARSVMVLGEPAAPRLAVAARAAPPPDRSIETSALRPTQPAAAEAVADAAPAEPDPRYVVAWPPVLSRSMVAFGVPLPAETQKVALAPRSPFSLPAVFRAGLAGDAFHAAPTPARAAVEEEPTKDKAAKRPAEPDAPAVATNKDTAPLKPQDKTPAPAAPPSVPATPPPAMRLE